MLAYLLILSIAYGIAYGITSTGLHLWRAIVGFALAFVVAWFGGSLLGTFLITWMKWGDAKNSLLPIIGKGFWWALFGAGVGVNRAKHKLRVRKAKSNPVRKDIVNNNDATKEKEIPHPSINADNFEKIAAEGMGDEKKEISKAEILKEEAANEEAHFFDKNIYRDNLLEQGCSKEAIDYLKNPIHVYSYMQKYKKTEEKILDAIKKGKLRGCYVGEALWVENKKI